MKWLLAVVIVFSLITVFELHQEYKKNSLSKKFFTMIACMEGLVIGISALLFLLMK